jgi:antitoxin component YwqK of YwqJK toxin-antitoxin module
MRNTIMLGILFLVACSEDGGIPKSTLDSVRVVNQLPTKAYVVRSTDTSLQLKNGVWYYKQTPFIGSIQSYDANGIVRGTQTIYQGKEEGTSISYYENGKIDAIRFYHQGEKDSVNAGWWMNGNPRFEYHFKAGIYEGDFKEWYENGKPAKHIVYQGGKEVSGKGWRMNGKVYMSFVMRDGRLYGLVNPNLCYSLKNERGEYVASVK